MMQMQMMATGSICSHRNGVHQPISTEAARSSRGGPITASGPSHSSAGVAASSGPGSKRTQLWAHCSLELSFSGRASERELIDSSAVWSVMALAPKRLFCHHCVCQSRMCLCEVGEVGQRGPRWTDACTRARTHSHTHTHANPYMHAYIHHDTHTNMHKSVGILS